jgi:hypothetical protein
MTVSKKDFIAEAADISRILTPLIDRDVLTLYLSARCYTLHGANPLFDRQRFLLAAQRSTVTKETP